MCVCVCVYIRVILHFFLIALTSGDAGGVQQVGLDEKPFI